MADQARQGTSQGNQKKNTVSLWLQGMGALSLAICTTATAHANTFPTDSMIKVPGAAALDRAFERLQQAYNQVQAEPAIRSLLDKDQGQALSLADRLTATDLETTKFQHYYRGLEVVGSMAFHHRGRAKAEVMSRIALFDLDTNASITKEAATEIARSVVGDRDLAADPVLKILPDAEDGSAKLVYWVELQASRHDGGRELLIDAHSGNLIANMPMNLAIAPVQVFSAQNQGLEVVPQEGKDSAGKPTFTGCQVTDLTTKKVTQISPTACNALPNGADYCQLILDGSPININAARCAAGSTADAAAARARANSTAVLNYYLGHHNRNSYDNRGSASVSVVHAGDSYVNAHWDRSKNIMAYGDGDAKYGFADFTLAVDVAGHEMTHGVISKTAQLMYMGQSGALNEAYADFFGIMIANGGKDWALGKEIFLDRSKGQAVRNLANPAALNYCAVVDDQTGKCAKRLPYPSHMREALPNATTCNSDNDQCWVHSNSTIPGHASYLIVQAIGAAKAEHLYFLTMTQSLTARDDFKTASAATKKVCAQIYDAATCTAVTNAFAQVGL